MFKVGKESELERLVRVANETNKELRKHQRMIECKGVGAWGTVIDLFDWGRVIDLFDYEIRIKPAKPVAAFEPFYVGEPKYADGVGLEVGQWQVVHLPDTEEVKIGCQTFLVAKLLEALASVSEYGGIYSLGEKGTLFSMKDGIRLEQSSNHKLSWADADRLLEALRKVPSSERKAA